MVLAMKLTKLTDKKKRLDEFRPLPHSFLLDIGKGELQNTLP